MQCYFEGLWGLRGNMLPIFPIMVMLVSLFIEAAAAAAPAAAAAALDSRTGQRAASTVLNAFKQQLVRYFYTLEK